MDMLNIDILRDVCQDNQIKWTLHALSRIRKRKISSGAVISTILNGDIVKHYHDDKPFPSWLIYNNDSKSPLHVVTSTDGKYVYIITAYVPTLDEWEDDYVTRRR